MRRLIDGFRRVISNLPKPCCAGARHDHFETLRRAQLATSNPTYRLFESLIDEIGGLIRALAARSGLERLRHSLSLSGDRLPWRPEEFLAGAVVEGILCGALTGGALSIFSVKLGLLLGAVMAFVVRIHLTCLDEKSL